MKNTALLIALIFSLSISAQNELVDTFEIAEQAHVHISRNYNDCTGDPECAKQQEKEFKECYWEGKVGFTRKEVSVSKIVVIQGDAITVKFYNGLSQKLVTYEFPNSFIRNENNGMEIRNFKQSITFYNDVVVLSDKYGLTEFNFDGHKEESKDK